MINCQHYTLSESVDQYLGDRMISKKKYFANYLRIAKLEWQKLFRGTLWTVQSRWLTLKKGEPYNYIDIPTDASRIFEVDIEDKCKLLQPLFYNSQINIISKPTTKNCGCGSCECGGLCSDVNGLTTTTKFLFSINGIDYYEKCWIELCPNGDILQWCETPTKKYNNIIGDAGDFNDDFNNDYDIAAAPFSGYTIETVKSQKKICKLEVLPCGCPAETTENEQILFDNCSCFIGWNGINKKKCCKVYEENINNNYRGEIKISECGKKLYYKPSKHWKQVTDTEFPEFLLLTYQTNGLADGEVLVPDYALEALETGINYRSKRFNSAYSQTEKDDALYQNIDACAKIIGFLNPISLVELSQVQDISVKW